MINLSFFPFSIVCFMAADMGKTFKLLSMNFESEQINNSVFHIYCLNNLIYIYYLIYNSYHFNIQITTWKLRNANIFSKLKFHLRRWMIATQSCPTLWDPMDCSLPSSFVHGILQARILKWVAISFSSASSQPRDRTQVSCMASRLFTIWTTKKSYY